MELLADIAGWLSSAQSLIGLSVRACRAWIWGLGAGVRVWGTTLQGGSSVAVPKATCCGEVPCGQVLGEGCATMWRY